MSRKSFKLSLCAILAMAASGCSQGEYNDLKCDDSYQSECLTNTKYMACISNVLTVIECEPDAYCQNINANGVSSAGCVKYDSGSHNTQPTTCGNGRIDNGEECDGSNLNGKSCADVIANSAGTLACSPSTCLFDSKGCVVADCGNGVVEEGEDCEGSDLNGKTCADLYEGSSGNLSCNSNTCYYNTSECEVHKPNPERPGCQSDDDCVFEDHPNMVCQQGKCIEEEWKSMEVGEPCGEFSISYGMNNDFRFCSDNDEIVYCDIAKDGNGEPILDSEGNTSFVVHKRDCSQLGGCTVFDALHLSGDTNVYLELACKNDTMLLTNEEANAMCKEDGQKEAYCGNLAGYDEAPLESYYLCVYNHKGEFTALNGATRDTQDYKYCMNHIKFGDVWEENGYGVCADNKKCEDHAMLYCAYEYRCIDSEQVEYCDLSKDVPEGIVKCNDLKAGTVCATVGAEDGCYKTCDKLGATRYECTTYTDFLGEEFVASIEYTCAKGRDGNLYETEAGMNCSNECGSDGKCVLYAEDENAPCDINTYQSRCENNSIVSCLNSRVKSRSCGDDKICHFVTYPQMAIGFNGSPLCLDPCENEGELKRECEPDYFNEFGVWIQGENSAFVCTRTDDGLVYIENDYANCRYGCTEDGTDCKKLLDIEGTDCDTPGEMLDCEGSIIVYCGSDGKIKADECAVFSPDATFDRCIKTANGAACTKLCDPSGDINISEPYYPTNCEYDYDRVTGIGKYHYYEKYCENVNGIPYEFYKIVKECEYGCDPTYGFRTCKETED